MIYFKQEYMVIFMELYKKMLIIIAIICCYIIIDAYFGIEQKDLYSLDELKDSIKETKTLVICLKANKKNNGICPGEAMLRSITDEDTINEITSLIMESKEIYNSNYPTMSPPAFIINAFDKNGIFLANIYYYPYVGLEKGGSKYHLESKNENRLLEILQ